MRSRDRAEGARSPGAGSSLPRPPRAAQAGGGAAGAGLPLRPDKGSPSRRRKERGVEDRHLRLIAARPLERLVRTVEALLVVSSSPLSVDELAQAAEDEPARIEAALDLLKERYREGRSGIVLERVAGGYAFRASREAASACARLVEPPVERTLSQAALETLAIVAYLGPCTRPEIARLRGVASDTVVAGLVERGLLAEAGREPGAGGGVRYRVTELFLRVFGLESVAGLPPLEDLGGEASEIRARLEAVAGRRLG
ncbi:MAG: SMC-Scp complex subunit ScpB [Chloroflexota bacterium]